MINKETSEANLQKLADPNRGRIVAVSLSADGEKYRLFTGMGGRSDGSKNRYYSIVSDMNGQGDYVRTAVHDPNLQKGDPSATLYVAQRSWRGWHVASNGEQTEGIAFSLATGGGFADGQTLYKNEGQKNEYTARITVATHRLKDYAYIGKIVSKPESPDDSTYHVWKPELSSESMSLNPGEGYYTVTYDGTLDENGKPDTKPNYEDPWGILLPDSLEDALDAIWEKWHGETRANLVGKEIDRNTGLFTYSRRSIHEGRT